MLLADLLLRRLVHRSHRIRLQTTQLRLLTTLLLRRALAPAFLSLVVGDVARSGRGRLILGLRFGRRRLARCVGGVGTRHRACLVAGLGLLEGGG